MTFQYQTDFLGLSRAWKIPEKIQDFPGFSRLHGNPELHKFFD